MAKEMTAEELKAEELRQRNKQLELMERQIALQETQASALKTQTDRTAPKENPDYTPTGIYYAPDGRQWKDHLLIEYFDGPIRLNRTPITQAEYEQLIRLRPIETASLLKVDRTTVKASVVPTMDASGRVSKLQIVRPMGKDDNAQHFPPLDEMVKQLADQAEALATVAA